MIPQDTLTIIEKEAKELYPDDIRVSTGYKQLGEIIYPETIMQRLAHIAGAKRGYELAMGQAKKEREDLCLIPENDWVNQYSEYFRIGSRAEYSEQIKKLHNQ